jgi:hypothetical protein
MSLTERPQPGFKCAAYFDSADAVAAGGVGATWAKLAGVRDLNRPDSREKIDASARWSESKRSIVGMLDGSVTFEYVKLKNSSEAGFAKLKAKYDAGEPIHVAIADGDITVAGTVYRRDWYAITKFDEKQEMANCHLYDVELTPTPVFNSGALVEYSFATVSGS